MTDISTQTNTQRLFEQELDKEQHGTENQSGAKKSKGPWTVRYHPKRLSDVILPKSLSDTLHAFVKRGAFPPLIMSGASGIGKSAAAQTLLTELNVHLFECDGTKELKLNDYKRYAETVSFNGLKKYIVVSDADLLSKKAQAEYAAFIDYYASNCGFILIATKLKGLIASLRSRCAEIDFDDAIQKDKTFLISEYNERLCQILDNENISYEREDVVAVIKKYFPDFRRILNECEARSANGNYLLQV
jgi:DNA polymerase III delta prime subunit